MATQTNNNNELLLNAFAKVDTIIDDSKNSSIKNAVKTTLQAVSLTASIINNELIDVLEDQVIDRATKRAKLLAKGL